MTSKECINKMVEKYSWLGKEYCRLIENENPYKPNQQIFEKMADKILKDLDRLEQYDKALEDKYDYSKCSCFDELMIRCKHLEKENQELSETLQLYNEKFAGFERAKADLMKENQELRKIKEKAICEMQKARKKMDFYAQSEQYKEMYAYFNGVYKGLQEVLECQKD